MGKRFLSIVMILSMIMTGAAGAFAAEGAVSDAAIELAEEEILASKGFGYEHKIKSVSPVRLIDFEKYHLGGASEIGIDKVTGEPYPQKSYDGGTCVTTDGKTYLYVIPSEPLTEGRYLMSFDIKQNKETDSFMYLRYNADGVKGKFWESLAIKGGQIGHISNWKFTVSKAYKADTWVHVAMYIDFDKNLIEYYVDNEYIGSAGNVVDMYSFAFINLGNSGIQRSIDNIAMFKFDNNLRKELKNLGIAMPANYGDDVNISINTPYSGNIFTEFSDVKINVNLQSKVDEDTVCDIEYAVKNYVEDVVWTDKRTDVLIKAGEAFEEALVPAVDKYDIYTLYVTVTPQGEDAVSISLDREFSVVNVPTPGYKNPYFGTCTHPGRARTNWEEIDRAVQISGMKYLRTDYAWSRWETAPGKYGGKGEAENKTKNFYRDMAEAGFEHIAIFTPNNNIYGSYAERAASPEAMLALEKAAEAFAREYKGVIDVIELGNEINFTSVDTLTPEDYAKHCQAAYRGLKKGNPDCTVLSQGFTRTAGDYIYRTLKTPGGTCWDAIAIHAYHGQGSPESMRWDEACAFARDAAARAGYPDMEVWNTEGNTSTHTSYNTNQQHALNLIRQYVQTQAFKAVDKFIMYQIQTDQTSITDNEHYFGALQGRTTKNANAPRPIYLALCNYNALTENAEVDKAVKLEDRDIWLARYKKPDGKNVLIMYADRRCDLLSLDLGAASGTLYDINGNPTALSSSNGKYTFSLSDQPIYFEYAGDKLEVLDDVIALDKDMAELTKGGTTEFSLTLPEGATIEVVGRSTMTVENSQNGNCAVVKITADELPEKIELPGMGVKAGMYTEHYMDHGTQIFRDYVFVYVNQNGAIASVIQLPIEYAYASADVMMTVEPYDNSNTKFWKGVLEVTNNKSEPISGVIKMVSPAAMAEKLSEIDVDDMQPGETKTFTLNIPQEYSKGSRLYSGIFTLSDGEEISFALGDDPRTKKYKSRGNINIGNIEKVKNEAPVIDGVLDEDEWKSYKLVDFDKSQVNYGTDTGLVIDGVVTKESFGADADYGGMSDFSGSIYSAWDEDYLYIAALVYDDVHWNNEPETRGFNRDSMSLITKPTTTQRHDTRIDAFLTGYYNNESYADYDFSEYNEKNGVLFNNYTPIVGARNAAKLNQFGENAARAMIVRKDNVTIYEYKLPWYRFASEKSQDMKQMYIQFSIRDYDGDRNKTYSYSRWFVFTDTKE